ncbi:MAG TPA: ComF family protein [Myxococcales bacterium]|nr:ComF family protein [Myxococcales bacterium]
MSISLHFHRAVGGALGLLFPARCASCGAPGEEPFCGVCADTLLPLPPGCPVCGEPADEALLPLVKPRRCPHCRARPPPFAFASAPYLHGGALAEAIHRFKYEQREDLGRALSVLFDGCPVPESDLLVPIPLHPSRLRQRGYDQARLLADGAARRFGLPVAPLLHRTRATGQQVGRDRAARERNVRGAFRAAADLAGVRVCLVDDVFTTGATASAAAQALLEAGAARVEVRTLARA